MINCHYSSYERWMNHYELKYWWASSNLESSGFLPICRTCFFFLVFWILRATFIFFLPSAPHKLHRKTLKNLQKSPNFPESWQPNIFLDLFCAKIFFMLINSNNNLKVHSYFKEKHTKLYKNIYKFSHSTKNSRSDGFLHSSEIFYYVFYTNYKISTKKRRERTKQTTKDVWKNREQRARSRRFHVETEWAE